MDYIPNSQSLFDLSHDDFLFLAILSEVSQTVRSIHLDPRRIIISDLHFDRSELSGLFCRF